MICVLFFLSYVISVVSDTCDILIIIHLNSLLRRVSIDARNVYADM